VPATRKGNTGICSVVPDFLEGGGFDSVMGLAPFSFCEERGNEVGGVEGVLGRRDGVGVESSYVANKSVCRFRTGIDLGG
jgi:hypothetical protein